MKKEIFPIGARVRYFNNLNRGTIFVISKIDKVEYMVRWDGYDYFRNWYNEKDLILIKDTYYEFLCKVKDRLE